MASATPVHINNHENVKCREWETSQPNSPTTESTTSVTMRTGKSNEYRPLNISEDPNDRKGRIGGINRKALLSFLVIVVVVVTIITVTVVFVGYSGSKKDAGDKKLRREKSRYQFEDMFNDRFSPDMPDEKWISDNAVLTSANGSIYKFNVATNETLELISGDRLESLGSSSQYYSLSPDETWMLLASESIQKYRYSTVGKYFAVKLKSNDVVTISTSGETSSSPIQYISWGKHHNSIVFVSENDIYWIKSIDNPKPVRITSTGKDKTIFNGIPDWVYEEEILGRRPAVVISPDEKHLSYAVFDDTEVPLYKISIYGNPVIPYTRIQDIAYPKPGFPNPIVRIYIHDVDANNKFEVKPPTDMTKSKLYFTNLVWASNETVSVTWMNRAQNVSVVVLCSAKDGHCEQNYKMVVSDGWVDQDYLDPVFSSDGSYYFQVLPKNEGKNGDFLHVAKIPSTRNANNAVRFLTEGEWEVKKIVSFDEKSGVVYYESSEISPTQFHLYSVDMKGKRKCLSCDLKETKEKHCRNYYSSFSTKSSWYILTCSGPSTPISWFRSTRDDTALVLESSEELQEVLKSTSMPTFEYFKVKTTDGKYDLHMRELRPPDFDEKKKYAVFFSVYGGPGSQEVTETYQTGFHVYLTSNFDVVVCEVDGRGTRARGRMFEHAVYDQLGEYERDDTLAAARYMRSKKYVDPDRMAIWGWSYGGFLTSYILSTQGERIFQSGVAVAPVTDWRYYDSIYTERYMGQPDASDNFIGYEQSSVLRHASNISDNSFLLIHGTGDDNVHFQNTAQLVRVLTEAGVKFEMQIYTDKHHSLEGINIHKHLYGLITDFLKEKLKL